LLETNETFYEENIKSFMNNISKLCLATDVLTKKVRKISDGLESRRKIGRNIET